MKDKKIVAMFITSIVAFVASLTISLGVAFALADPVAAVGLAEISYTVSTSETVSQEVVFDPVSAYNGEIEDGVYVHDYDNIQYANELLPDNIKLLKVTITNDTAQRAKFRFNVAVEGETNAVNYVQFRIINADSPNVIIEMSEGYFPEQEIAPNAVAHYIIAGYVNDEEALTENVNFGVNMTMKVSVVKVEME